MTSISETYYNEICLGNRDAVKFPENLMCIEYDLKAKLYDLTPKVLSAVAILVIGVILAWLLYKFLIYFFKKIKLNELVDKLKISFDEEKLEETITKEELRDSIEKRLSQNRFTDKIKVDSVIAKASSYYIAIVFFRISISQLGIVEVEEFLRNVINYLPNLFVGVVILFFGIRFANFIYDVVYHTLSLTKEKTSIIIATGSKVVILFITFITFSSYAKLVSEEIIYIILIGFISTLSLAGGLAFGLGGKDIAKDILNSFKK